MLRFAVLLLSLIACGFAADVDECRWGESYWCSSLDNAKTCGAIEHCKSTVWKNQILKTDDSEYCEFCKSVVQDVAKFVKDNRTEQDILRFIKNACNVIPVKGVSVECSRLADNFLTEILGMVVQDMNPQTICGLLKLCAGFEDTVSHATDLPESVPAVEQAESVNEVLSPVRAEAEPICGDCKKFFQDIKDQIVSNATEDKIEALIDQAVCSLLGTYEPECKVLVKSYLPEIMSYVINEFDPSLICGSFGFCAKSVKDTENFFAKLRTAKSSTDGCTICKTVFKDFQDLDRDATVQKKVKESLKAGVCSLLGTYKSMCESLIDAYGAVVFQLLANELDPESRCRSLGFCAAAEEPKQDVTRESTPVSTGQKLADTPQCTVCKLVVGEIDAMLKQNISKQEIISALDKVCSLMPESIKESCVSFVKEYASVIIDLLVQELDPNTLCSVIGICSSKTVVLPAIVKDASGCIACEAAVQYLMALINEDDTVAEIDALLANICNFIPEPMRPECNSVIKQYGPLIIQYLTTALTPKAICQRVGICQQTTLKAVLTEKKVVKESHPLLGEIECSWGPKHWCASRENAEACKASDYCEQTGWDF